ncbi:sarcosine oxidase subunit gamma [Roseovarius sp. TE539]|uniref:sarcosine oxidase subunit gamma n=1 Tax=Roseovarius sp. TE539 TaxID=2249812 RepID=UPI000DDD00EB|nr:sarcosine oxidase subunit gamma family protein [Roseovarius sp. TE539]RBI69089.1 sarcosine oxidase subunit gamma [Roseovarius sp. TE539]
MSDAVSALEGAREDGFATVEELGLKGMITLRGGLDTPEVGAAVEAAVNLAVPGRGEVLIADGGDHAVAWMSPDELLLVMSYEEAEASLAGMRDALQDQHALVVNVSDARAVFQVSGAGCREVIAKLCPVDMSPGAFGPGQFRRTRMAQVPAAFWMPDDQTVQVVCFRSVAVYVFDLLRGASATGGEVGYFG